MARSKRGKKRDRRSPKALKACDQSSSSFMALLPRELRDEVYSWVFSSTRITFGESKKELSGRESTIKKSRPNSLALLYTCQKIHQEARGGWIGCVLFNFETSCAMLDTLSELPSSIISQLRHVRISGKPLMLSFDDDDAFYRIASVLKLLPDLRLDTLTVLAGCASRIGLGGSPELGYDIIDGLVKHGNGWKNLYFITPDSSMLGCPKSTLWSHTFVRQPQPGDWNEAICARDGANSGASVTIYRSTIAQPGAIINPLLRERYQQHADPDEIEYGAMEDHELMSEENKYKEMLIVVRRGDNADIIEKRDPPFDDDIDMRAWAYNMTWKQIRKMHVDWSDDEDDILFEGLNVNDDKEPIEEELDSYGCHAHDIDWKAFEYGVPDPYRPEKPTTL